MLCRSVRWFAESPTVFPPSRMPPLIRAQPYTAVTTHPQHNINVQQPYSCSSQTVPSYDRNRCAHAPRLRHAIRILALARSSPSLGCVAYCRKRTILTRRKYVTSGMRADKLSQVNVPKTRRTYCKGKDCKKHTQHKVTRQ
jgi:hypothetical protein